MSPREDPSAPSRGHSPASAVRAGRLPGDSRARLKTGGATGSLYPSRRESSTRMTAGGRVVILRSDHQGRGRGLVAAAGTGRKTRLRSSSRTLIRRRPEWTAGSSPEMMRSRRRSTLTP